MKVLHFTTAGGDSDYFRAVIDGHDHARFEVCFGTLAPPGPLHARLKLRGIRTLALGAQRRSDFPAAVARLAWWLRRERIDVVQGHLYDGCAVGLAAATCACTPVRIFTAHHANDSLLHRERLGKRAAFSADGFVAKRLSDVVVAPSSHVAATARNYYGVPASKVVVIPYGFDLADWQPDPAVRMRIRDELHLGHATVVAAVGRLHWVKDLKTLLSAFALAHGGLRNARLLIVGSGPERDALERYARELGVHERVVFTGHRTDVPDLLAAADVLVNSSLTEAFNQALMEAMAMGVFVVATRVGAAADLIRDERYGLLVPAEAPELLSAALRRAVDVHHKNAEARRQLAAQYSISSMMSRYETLYCDLRKAR